MSSRAAEKLSEALSLFMLGHQELRDWIEEEYTEGSMAEDMEDESEDLTTVMEAAVVTELRTVLEGVMDVEDYSTEEVATALSALTEALEDLDPDVFEREGDEGISIEVADDDDDDDDIDYDDDDYDDDDYDDEDDDDEYEDDDDEEEDDD